MKIFMKVLIIEDEVSVAAELKGKLLNIGYDVVAIVDNYKDAIDEPKKQHIDLILLDINIQGVKSGIDIARYYRNEFDIPCIFITAFCSNAIINQAKEVGAYGHILKPYTEKDLRCAIEIAENRFKQNELVKKQKNALTIQVQKRTKELQLINEQLSEEVLYRIKLQDEIKEAENNERKRISQELHDGLSQSLTAIKFMVDAVVSMLDEGDEKHVMLTKSVAMIQESMGDVRDISHKLTPSYIKKNGLIVTLENTCMRLNEHGLFKVNFNAQDNFPVLKNTEEIALFRITQECITNAMVHSKGNKIDVSLKFNKRDVTLSITDNGIGVDKQKTMISNGIGFKNINQRCEGINAQCDVRALIPHGTEIIVKFKKGITWNV